MGQFVGKPSQPFFKVELHGTHLAVDGFHGWSDYIVLNSNCGDNEQNQMETVHGSKGEWARRRLSSGPVSFGNQSHSYSLLL